MIQPYFWTIWEVRSRISYTYVHIRNAVHNFLWTI
jgi:hypothetical protein